VLIEFVFLVPSILNVFSHIIPHSTAPQEFFNRKDWLALRKIARYITHQKNSHYVDYIISIIEGVTNEAKIIILIALLVYITISAICFFFIWIPYTLRLKKGICRTNSMLLLIPIEVYLNNRYLREKFDQKVAALTMHK